MAPGIRVTRDDAMELQQNDYWWQTLVIACPDPGGGLAARVRVRQPQGYEQQIETDEVTWSDGHARVRLLYPLIDEGRYEPSHGTWNGAWEMGLYRFEVELERDGAAHARDELTLDPHTFFPFDRMPIAVDARTQFVECATRQMLYEEEAEASVLIRIRRHRVTRCHVEVDVVRREGHDRLAGPWRLRLGHAFHEQRFALAGWADGEYWVRVRTLVDGRPVGPCCVRKFWLQRPLQRAREGPLRLGGFPEVMVDADVFERCTDIQFVPDGLERQADAPLVTPTEPHEEQSLAVAELAWNAEAQRYECLYRNGPGRVERKDTRARRAHLKMLAVSTDGRQWQKPHVGRVTHEGSTANNIVRDDGDDPSARERAHDIEHARFRFHDPRRDGPVDLAQMFVASGKGHFPFQCCSLQQDDATEAARRAEADEAADLRGDGLGVMDAGRADPAAPDAFRPRPGEFWPFEKRGDLYLVLSRRPVLYLGVGMDLWHTTESIRCHVELSDQGRLLWFFRPGAPAYPPHGVTYDNMHLTLRTLAVLWTDDGLTWHRRHVLAPDAFDPIGTQFYDMGMLQRLDGSGDGPGRPVLHKLLSKVNQAFARRNLYLGLVLIHDGIDQTQAPELMWTRDFLRLSRFREQRRPAIERGPHGSFDGGQIRNGFKYCALGDRWWHVYTGINTRHNGYGIMANWTSLDALRAKYPNHADAPYFTTWEGNWADGKQTTYLPGVARCRPHRLAHAEPLDARGTLTTHPLCVDGNRLRLNAATEPGGHITVHVEDASGDAVLPGPARFEGDDVAASILDLEPLRGRTVRLRFELDRARLYAFEIV